MMGLSDLVIAIDLSEDGTRVIVLIGAREHVLKSSDFLNYTSWIKHFRRIYSKRKYSYLTKLPKCFSKISSYLIYIKSF